MNKHNIYLIGLSGTGKSTIGKILSQIIKLPHIEMDEKITQKDGNNIEEIFDKKGEVYFRNIESEILTEICSHKGYIVSTGGGVPIKNENRDIMLKSGFVVNLTASANDILFRVHKDRNIIRPLLGKQTTLQSIKNMMHERKDIYKFAQLTLNTSKKTPNDIALNISDNWNEWKKLHG